LRKRSGSESRENVEVGGVQEVLAGDRREPEIFVRY
jgi:hypothetical protein